VVYIKTAIRCVLSDISRTGARLSVDTPSALPEEFTLEIRTDLVRRCRVIWRGEKHIGVEYIETPKGHSGEQ